MRTSWLLFVFSAMAQANCLAVSSGKILAGDLADAVPFLKELNPDTPIGFSPLPGTQRIFLPRELALIAQDHGLKGVTAADAISSVCVERKVRPITREEMNAALVAALAMPDTELELIEFSTQPLPPGRLEFRRTGLSQPPVQTPDAPTFWNGRLIYDDRRSLAVWAKVKISAHRLVLVAAEDIAARTVIGTDDIKEVQERQFPFAASPMSRAEIIGKATRGLLPAGHKFERGALDDPKEISVGDRVRVSVIDGSTTLSLDAIAQSSGKRGESILVHNPSSGKSFRAVVEARGRVTVRPSPGV